MAESKQAWDQVGRDFTELGQHLKRHYSQQDTQQESQQESQQDTQQAEAEKPAPEDRRKVDAALRRLTESLDQIFTSLGDAIRDPEFGQQAKKTANSLGDALSSTFADVGRSSRSKSKDEPPPPEGG
jgi:uncharacterized FlaG/YvyC family protein